MRQGNLSKFAPAQDGSLARRRVALEHGILLTAHTRARRTEPPHPSTVESQSQNQ